VPPAVLSGSGRALIPRPAGPREHGVAIDRCEAETFPTRPLCAPGQRFDRYTSAIRHLDPPRLFESWPSYRLLGEQLSAGSLHCGLGAYFDKIEVSEALGLAWRHRDRILGL
jgi:hypothetical protein